MANDVGMVINYFYFSLKFKKKKVYIRHVVLQLTHNIIEIVVLLQYWCESIVEQYTVFLKVVISNVRIIIFHAI